MAIQQLSTPHNGAFVDSSNRTNPTFKPNTHAHLRPPASPALRKSPPTCTVSLASVSATRENIATIRIDHINAISFPSSSQCNSSLQGADSDSGCGEPEPRRRPRARTGHVQTPRSTRSAPKRPPKLKPAAKRVTSCATSRITSLVERSLAHHLQARVGVVSDGKVADAYRHNISQELLQQDELLAARLSTVLVSRRPVSPPPRAISIPLRPPSVLLSGSSAEMLPPPVPATSNSPRFIMTPARRGSVSSNIPIGGDTLSLSALVATLTLKRNNERETAMRRSVTTPSTSSAGASLPAGLIPGPSNTGASRLMRRHQCRTPSPLVQVTSAAALMTDVDAAPSPPAETAPMLDALANPQS
ncbi:hypothetical protein C8R43DRAFT_986583 [Mycena crocata]|nr:hypothetical protein C8R43DRAFT_986583 [Mycena crocata]